MLACLWMRMFHQNVTVFPSVLKCLVYPDHLGLDNTWTCRAGDLWEKLREEEVLQMKAVQPYAASLEVCVHIQHTAGQMCAVSQGCASHVLAIEHFASELLWVIWWHFVCSCTKAVPGMERGAFVHVIQSVLYWTVPTNFFFVTKAS